MNHFSTRQAAKKLGLTHASISRYLAAKKIPAPQVITLGGFRVHVWTAADIERVRKLLPKIANGRKTRHQKHKGKTQKPQPRAAVPHKKKK